MYIHFLDEQSRVIYSRLLIEFFGEEIEELENNDEIKSTEIIKKPIILTDVKVIDSTFQSSEDDDNSTEDESSDSAIFILNDDYPTSSEEDQQQEINKPESNYLFVVGKITNENYKDLLNLSTKNAKLIGLYLEFDSYYLIRDEILECFERVYFKQMMDYDLVKYKVHATYYNYLPDVISTIAQRLTPRSEFNFDERNLLFIISRENITSGKEVFNQLSLKNNLKIIDDSNIQKFNYHINAILNNDILITDNYVAIWLAIVTNTPFFVINSTREVSILSSEIGIAKFNFDTITDFSLKFFNKITTIREKSNQYLANSLNIINNFRQGNFFADNLLNNNKSGNKFYLEKKEINNSNLAGINKLLVKESNLSGIYLDFDLRHSFDNHSLLHPWVGFVHSVEDCEYLFSQINFRTSLFICRGLFSFNRRVKLYLDERLENINCVVLTMPIYHSENLVKYHLKSQPIVLICGLFGDLEIIFNLWKVWKFKIFLPEDNLAKYSILIESGKSDGKSKKLEEAILKIFGIKIRINGSKIFIDDKENLAIMNQIFVDSLISRSEIFSRSQVNKVILMIDYCQEIINEAIIRNIPLLLEKNTLNMELLGSDYPLFIDLGNIGNLDLLKLSNLKQAINSYRKVKLDNFSFGQFVRSLNNSINLE